MSVTTTFWAFLTPSPFLCLHQNRAAGLPPTPSMGSSFMNALSSVPTLIGPSEEAGGGSSSSAAASELTGQVPFRAREDDAAKMFVTGDQFNGTTCLLQRVPKLSLKERYFNCSWTEIRVLIINVGPKSFIKQSDICQKYVRKLSVAKISWNSVKNVSEFCQKTVRCKIVSEVC